MNENDLESLLGNLEKRRILLKRLREERRELHSAAADMLSLVSSKDRTFLDDIIDLLREGAFLDEEEEELIKKILAMMAGAGEDQTIQSPELRDRITEFQKLQCLDIKMTLESWRTLYPI